MNTINKNFSSYTVLNTKLNNTAFSNTQKTPSFGATDSNNSQRLTPEQASALAAQRLNQPKSPLHITEEDINFEVTCIGHSQVKGNTRKIYDYRCSMQNAYGLDWFKNFKKPHIIRNGNLDEKRNGETTAIVFPLNPNTPGRRGGDHMAMVLNGNIEKDVISELVVYMEKVGILNKKPIADINYYVNSLNPKDFMANPKIKTLIANFFRQKETEQTNASEKTQTINNDNTSSKLKASDINIVNVDQKADKSNTRPIKDYLRYYLKNGKKFTVIHDKFIQNNQEKDMTAILIPTPKSDWDCITVTIDRKIPEQECKNLINHLVRQKMANIENENFRNAIIEYLNNKN